MLDRTSGDLPRVVSLPQDRRAGGPGTVHASPTPDRPEARSPVSEVVREARQALDMPVAFLSRLVQGRRVIEAVDASCPVPFRPGDSDAAADTYCQRIVDGLLPLAISDSRANPVTAALPVTAELDIGSHVGVPIHLADGSVYGTLCAYSHHARPVTERDAAILNLAVRAVAQHLAAGHVAAAEHKAIRERIRRVIDDSSLRSVFQPIVDPATGNAVSIEALTRFDGPPHLRPDEWFTDAARVGEAAALEIAAASRAIEGLASVPPGVALSINVSAAVVVDPRFAEWMAAAPLDRLILELTEHEAVDDYDAINVVLDAARARGLQLAVDDVGAGYASMRHILLLHPDLLKLDVTLVRGLEADGGKRSLCAAITTFANSLGARVVAEGVETAAELTAVRKVGVDYVQGYHFARPTPLAEVRYAGYLRANRRRTHEPGLAPATAQVIRELADTGASPSTIAARLNHAGVPSPRGVRWHGNAVSQILGGTLLPDGRARSTRTTSAGPRTGSRRVPPPELPSAS